MRNYFRTTALALAMLLVPVFSGSAFAEPKIDGTSKKSAEKSATKPAEPAKDAAKKSAPTKRTQQKGDPAKPMLAPSETFSAETFSVTLPSSVEEGSILLVHVQGKPGVETVALRWRNKKHTVSLVNGQALALLPSPVEPETRGLNLDAANGKDRLTVPVRILPVNWAIQRITVDSKYVDPPKDVMDRIANDRARTKAALAAVRPERFWTPPFTRPVSGGISSAYGGKRVFNNQPRSRHRGVDLRGAEGTPIVSAAAGRVILAEEQYFSGNVVYVDHGQGLVTMYCHMSVMHVTPGQTVQPGETLGLVGSTGRVTGPHLHLSTLLHAESVNPMALFVY